MARIYVDGTKYASKAEALKEFKEAMIACDGSEQERMTFAYCAILEGCKRINTYKNIAV